MDKKNMRTYMKIIFGLMMLLTISLSSTKTFAASCGNIWLPWPWAVYKSVPFTQRNSCGQTRPAVGTKDHIYWRNLTYQPTASTVCKNVLFSQTLSYGSYSTDRPNFGTKIGSNWAPARGSRCVGQPFTQTSNCGVTRSTTGTKPVGAFTPAVNTQACGTPFTQTRICGSSRTAVGAAPSSDWQPALNTICAGESFTQTRSCGSPRSVIGTKPAGSFTPEADTVACGVEFTQTRICGSDRQAIGTKPTDDWLPAANSICYGETFTQTRSCGAPREAIGSRTDGICNGPDADWDGDGIPNSNDPYPLQHATQCQA